MVERAATQGSFSVEDYLEMEKTATVRHEYVAGEIFAMTGATRRHNRIAGNVYRRLADAAAGGPCRVYMETVKLRVEEVFYYPDVMVARGEEPDDPYYEDGPCLVAEVLSPKTETTDRREKLAAYRRIPNLKAYLILDQDRARIERHFRNDEGVWQRADLLDEGSFTVPCPETSLSLAEIHEGL